MVGDVEEIEKDRTRQHERTMSDVVNTLKFAHEVFKTRILNIVR